MDLEILREGIERALHPHLQKRQRTFKAQQQAQQATATVARKDMAAPLQGQTGCCSDRSGVAGGLQLDVQSHLNKLEGEVLALMSEAVKLSNSCTVVRVAGGWVRDKLLGLENEDIDIALDNCTGRAFAELVNAYLKSQGQTVGKVAVIEANPEQSKHLQTARMKIMGVWVDLVNLRTETYRSNSRIPDASFGTAEEDALRRDFTLNSLFYNVNSGEVEDMTGRGVDDLRDGVIRTPLSPMVTFEDDPLRVLRAVRFAARFGFTLHEDLRAAAQNGKIQAALSTKVSRERVGAELSGMLAGKMAQPALALSLLQELGLAPAVYAPPEHTIPSPPDRGYDWAHGAEVARAAARVLAFRTGMTSPCPGVEAPGHALALTMEASGQSAAGGGGRKTSGEEAVATATTATAAESGEMEQTDSSDSVGGAEEKGGVGETTGDKGLKDEPLPATVAAAVATAAEGGAAVGVVITESETSTNALARAEDKGKGKGKAKPEVKGGAESGGKGGSNDRKDGDDPDTLVRELFLCAALFPLVEVKHRTKKGKSVPAAQSVVQESLKLSAKEAKNVGEILELVSTFRSLADAYAASSGAVSSSEPRAEGGFSRLAVGLAVRQAKELWPTCVDLCCAVEMSGSRDEHGRQGHSDPVAAPCPEGAEGDGASKAWSGGKRTREENDGAGDMTDRGEGGKDCAIMDKYAGFAKAVRSMGLGRAWRIAPLVRGNEIIAILQVPKGPEIGKLMAKQACWQLENPEPEGTRERCITFLKAALSADN